MHKPKKGLEIDKGQKKSGHLNLPVIFGSGELKFFSLSAKTFASCP